MLGVVRICMAVSFGAWLAMSLWLVVQSPWMAVFCAGTGLGLALLECSRLRECQRSQEENAVELEKQVVALRTTLAQAVWHEEGVEHVRARFRYRHRPGSSSSL